MAQFETVLEKDQEQVQQETIDFKMVTFSLGGKDYGIDIMRVKEIAKFTQFTYVPNTAHFVRGVYNLRGDIISIVDLRLFFNLPAEQKEEDQPENGLILRLENNLLGVIVDSIDKVVGISSRHVQPPHPIFGDINVKYISGVAEYDDRLYIILDVDRIFRREEEKAEDAERDTRRMAEQLRSQREVSAGREEAFARASQPADQRGDDGEVQKSFLADGVKAFSGFHISPVNDGWFSRRVDSWLGEKKKSNQDYQFKEISDAEAFMAPFYSRYTGGFWRDSYAEQFITNVPVSESTVYNVWNPGCGSGHESYSVAALLKKRFPNQQIKIWAGDKDLLQISTAPNLVFSEGDVPSEWGDLIVQGKNGVTFNSEIKGMILFEFSDILSAAAMPKMDVIVARDLLSFHTPDEQQRIMERFDETLKPGGVLVLGDNEDAIDRDAWEPLESEPVNMFIHR